MEGGGGGLVCGEVVYFIWFDGDGVGRHFLSLGCSTLARDTSQKGEILGHFDSDWENVSLAHVMRDRPSNEPPYEQLRTRRREWRCLLLVVRSLQRLALLTIYRYAETYRVDLVFLLTSGYTAGSLRRRKGTYPDFHSTNLQRQSSSPKQVTSSPATVQRRFK